MDPTADERAEALSPRRAGARAIRPPGTGTASGSFTFVLVVPPGTYTVNIDWGSPTGVPVTLKGGSLVVQYGAA